MDTNLKQSLADLFKETARLHHQAYIETDGVDEEWPLWYADYLHEKLAGFLEAKFTKSELVYLLVLVDREQRMQAPGADWPAYYARFFLQRYR